MGRNQRNKGVKVKMVVQAALLFAVVGWLLYQIKNSQDNKMEYTGSDENKLSKKDTDVYLGRKGKAGSEKEISMDTQEGNFYGSGSDALDSHSEVKDVEIVNMEHEESQEDITNHGDKESGTGEHINENDNADSHIDGGDETTDKGMSEDTHETSRLPSQMDSDNPSEQNDNRNRVNFLDENGLPKDGNIVQNITLSEVNSDDEEATKSTEETGVGSTSENAMSDTELPDNAIPGENSSFPDNSSNIGISTEDEGPKKEAVESEGDNASDTEITSNSTLENATTDTRSDDELVNLSLPSEQEIVVSTNNEAPVRETEESQVDSTAEAETSNNHTMEYEKSETGPEGELANSSIPNEQIDIEMPTNKEAPRREAVESQVDGASEVEIPGNNSFEEAKIDTRSDNAQSILPDEQTIIELPTNNEVLEREAFESQGENNSAAEITGNNALEDEKTNDELANSSVTNKENNMDILTSNEASKMEGFESQGSASESESTGNIFDEEAKSETRSGDEFVTNEQNSIPTNGTASDEAFESQGNGASEAESIVNNALEDVKSESISNVDTGSESGESTVL